ncbi:CLUMA_CG015723, isoform A [Clunio marinus]|uniref:CLUMA_CG015723, isoform A n=1 Tax=Clunio marinus TaxID=568069 RepID=A0A1J1IPY7_9DIPT|nr:CLUMA_CG015723, isoform A [Clunio marinus]
MKDLLPDDVDVSNSEDEEDETSESVDASKKNSNMDFCENPETIRARREKQFQHRMAKKHPQVQQIPQDTKSRDVVGAQKGQGQSNQVLRNRQNKTTNKSSRANHNRKAGSTFKQSRGMF